MGISRLKILLLAFLLCTSVSSEVRRVLVLNSYHEGYHWTDRIMHGVKSVLEQEDKIELYIEYMDTKRCSDENYYEELKKLYVHKYSKINFDVIISSDNNAYNFLLKNRDELYPNVPVVFCGVNGYAPEQIVNHAHYTGVYEQYDILGSLDLISAIHPDTKRMYIISDDTYTGKMSRKFLGEAVDKIKGIEFVFLSNISIPALKDTLGDLGKGDIVVWAMYLRTPDGKSISSEESISLISQSSSVPTYSIWDVVGQGVVGGKVIIPDHQGTVAAQKAVQILNGTPASSIPVSFNPIEHIFDYEQLERFGISLDLLPSDRTILNTPTSFYGNYKTEIWSVVIAMFFMAVIIIVLSYLVYKRKEAEAELKKTHKQLLHSRKMDAIGKLAGGIAHDFSNMMGGVIGAAELLQQPAREQDETSQKYINIILIAANQAVDLTSKLLTFSHKGKNEKNIVDLKPVIDDTVSILQTTIARRITINSYNQGEYSVLADKSALQNVIMNMGINASHAIPEAGVITIKTSTKTLDKVFCKAVPFSIRPGEFMHIEIEDSGCGIPEENLQKIFEPFFTTKEEGEGTGLGLSAAYGTVVDHHGAITINSKVGIGTTINIYIPLLG